MSKKIAPLGEKRAPELREVLFRILETALKASEFISIYAEAWQRSDQELMRINLRDREPYFKDLMKDFHCAMRDLQILGRNNPEAQHVVRQMLFASHGTSIERIRHALVRASQVAKRYLATHPEKKEREELGRIFSMIFYLATCFDFWWEGYAKKEKARRKAAGFDD